MINFEGKYPHLTEFMDKSLYQEAAPTMEEAIAAYAINGNLVVNSVLSEINDIFAEDFSEDELLKFLERHSDYLEPEGANATLNVFKSILVASI